MDGHDSNADTGCGLDPQDAALFDRLVDVGFDLNALTDLDDATRKRAARLVATLGLLDAYPVEPITVDDRETLIMATLARINRAEEEAQDRMQIDPPTRLPRMGLREMLAIAAVLIIGVALVFPIMRGSANQEGIQASYARLLDLSAAFSGFEADHDGAAPVRTLQEPAFNAVLGYNPTLLDAGQCLSYGVTDETFNNPLRPGQHGYSFHCQKAPTIIRVTLGGRTVIISDSNLMLDQVLSGEHAKVDQTLRSCVLFNDGSTGRVPCHIDDDHIWDCDRQRMEGRPVVEIFLIHGANQTGDQAGDQAGDQPAAPQGSQTPSAD